MTKHHRRPRSKGGDGKPDNISEVTRTQHEAWHTLFDNFDPQKICQIINDVWIDKRYKFECKVNSDSGRQW